MWICLNDAYISIVDKAPRKGCLMVRARREGDIERVFPTAVVVESFTTDYRWRAQIPRGQVAEAIAHRIMNVDYDNFKASVKDIDLHNDYMRVWSTMLAAQTRETTRQRIDPWFDRRSLPWDSETGL